MLNSKVFDTFINHVDCCRDLYKAMEKHDMSEVVMTAYDILKNKLQIPCKAREKVSKSEEKSNFLRKKGNIDFESGRYDKAFVLYNKALLFAPKDSIALKLAYSNKSALFHKIQRYQECINDIDKCFSLNCPEYLVTKLKNRREDAVRLLQPKIACPGDDYLKLKALLNETSYVSKCIDTIKEPTATKVVATTDIKLGSVVAIVQAFVSYTANTSRGSCYFCHKFSLNLVPCDGCCYVLFCSEKCKDLCMTEYHKIECDIMDFFSTLEEAENLMLKSVIKLILSGTWEEFIEISNTIEVNEGQFDAFSRFSVLNLRDDKPFKYGKMYNASFLCATIIRYLETVPAAFPESPVERAHAIRALARVMMYIVLNCKPHSIYQAAKNVINNNTSFNCNDSYGLYPFIENFRKSCEHNVTVAYIKKRVVLFAIRPIKSGSEITIPYVPSDMYMREDRETKLLTSFKYNGDVCKKCAENTHPQPSSVSEDNLLSYHQQMLFNRTINLVKYGFDKAVSNSHNVYLDLCETLAMLSEVPQSNHYKRLYEIFVNVVNTYLLHESDNMYINII